MTNPHLIEFIQSFNTHEIKVVEEYLEKMGPADLIDNKELELFRAVVYGKNVIDEEISDDKLPPLLKSNLYDKIIEALQSDDYLQNDALFNFTTRTKFSLGKKAMLIKAMHMTICEGKAKTLKKLIEETIRLAKDHEAYNIVVELLIRKKHLYFLNISMVELKKLNKEIAFYEYCNNAANFAYDSYHCVVNSNHHTKSLSKIKFEEIVKKPTQQMVKDYAKTNSQTINYFLSIFQVWICEYKKKYFKAINYCNKRIEILTKNKILNQKGVTGACLLDLGHYKIFNGDYNEAILISIESQKHFPLNSHNYILASEQILVANFYKRDYCIYRLN